MPVYSEANYINSYINDFAKKRPLNNATLPTHPAVIDWKALYKFMAFIMQSLYELKPKEKAWISALV
jgi:hypothetical protein